MPKCLDCGCELGDAWHWTGRCFDCAKKRPVMCNRCGEWIDPRTHTCVHKKPVGR